MKVMVACEFSGVVRDSFTRRGHDAWSCDLRPSERVGNHLQEEVENKATCLWLKGLPPLVPTDVVSGREPRTHHEPPSPQRWKNRSRTLVGIADAMAEQWGHEARDGG